MCDDTNTQSPLSWSCSQILTGLLNLGLSFIYLNTRYPPFGLSISPHSISSKSTLKSQYQPRHSLVTRKVTFRILAALQLAVHTQNPWTLELLALHTLKMSSSGTSAPSDGKTGDQTKQNNKTEQGDKSKQDSSSSGGSSSNSGSKTDSSSNSGGSLAGSKESKTITCRGPVVPRSTEDPGSDSGFVSGPGFLRPWWEG